MMNSAPTVHAAERTSTGTVTLTDLLPEEIETIVQYWHGGVADLQFLGIDPSLLGTRADTFHRFANAIRSGDPDQRTMAFAIKFDEMFIGYTLLNRYTPEINHSHWHITDSRFRAAGISTALYPYRIKMYFDVAPLQRLIHQTRTRNIGVNRMLDKFVPVAETCFVECPDGVAAPGEFHIRYVYADDVPEFFKRVSGLRRAAEQIESAPN